MTLSELISELQTLVDATEAQEVLVPIPHCCGSQGEEYEPLRVVRVGAAGEIILEG